METAFHRATASLCCLVSLFFLTASSHGDEAPVTFQAADLHASKSGANRSFRGGVVRSGRFEVHNATLLDLIRLAYDIDAAKVGKWAPWLDADRGDRVIGGPTWLDMDRFDLIAYSPPSTVPQEVRLMLRHLLAESFGLAAHREQRSLPVYVLLSGPRPKLKRAEGTGFTGCRADHPDINQVAPEHTRSCRSVTMAMLADMLPDLPAAYVDNAVVDKTGLDGSWDFELKWSDMGTSEAKGATIFDGVKQLGLELAMQSVPMEVLCVDAVKSKPAESRLEQSPLLQTAAEFEVASVKPTVPSSTMRSFRMQPSGTITALGVTLMTLIQVAWAVTPDMIIAPPKWLESDRFDIVAKAAMAGASQPFDIETLRPMLRALLRDRFKLAAHLEKQPVTLYGLTVGKRDPNLKAADPNVRAGCRFTRLPPRTAAGSPLTTGVVCRNITMPQFAEQLPAWAPSYFDHSVIDLTGLQGGWDFSLRWTPKRNIPSVNPQERPASDTMVPATAPTGGVTILEAIEHQLGLKIQLQKHPSLALVLDHVEQKPTEN